MVSPSLKRCFILCATAMAPFACCWQQACAQQAVQALEERVVSLENYVQGFDAAMVDLSKNLNQNIQEYTQGLGQSLDEYSQKLQMNIDQRLNGENNRTVVLNPYSRAYQSIETNTGVFLVAVERVEDIDNGFRLHLKIGNPHYADFQNFNLKFFWGPRWDENLGMGYNEWRTLLNGVEFSFKGKIEKGMWNPVTADLISLEKGELAYLECEMTVSGVELGQK